jgi:hypothetical protein
MGKLSIEQEMEIQMQIREDERDARMDIIGQNGNDGEHYEDEHELKGSFDVGQSGDLTPAVEDTFSWVNPDAYVLDTSKIYSIDDIVDVLACMNLQLKIMGKGDLVQQRLIEKGIFKKI